MNKNISIVEANLKLKNKQVSSVELTKLYLSKAKEKHDSTHAYLQIADELALKMAQESDARIAAGKMLSSLDGVPVAVKDNMMVTGLRNTCGSKILSNYVAPYDATVVAKLKSAGAVILGKTNMDDAAMGSSCETSAFGPSKNPYDESRIPGGSSGGSAVAVAEASALCALGSDTGGSIRQPAAMCGIVGLKPTYGRVSRYGLAAMASSFDQIGPMTSTVEDAKLMLEAIEGHDGMDSTSVPLQSDWLIKNFGEKIEGMKIGLPKEYFVSGMDAGVESKVNESIKALENLGAKMVEVSLPNMKYALAVYYVLMPCEVSANLSRLDGIRYGNRIVGANLEDTYKKTRGLGFGREVRRRIMLGNYALSSGYYDAYYLKALKLRRLIADDFANALASVDCLLTPTTPTTAWKIGEKFDDPTSMYLADIFTVSVNVAGLPAISIPCGLSDGLPVGLQLIGRHFDESTILRVANAFEKR